MIVQAEKLIVIEKECYGMHMLCLVKIHILIGLQLYFVNSTWCRVALHMLRSRMILFLACWMDGDLVLWNWQGFHCIGIVLKFRQK